MKPHTHSHTAKLVARSVTAIALFALIVVMVLLTTGPDTTRVILGVISGLFVVGAVLSAVYDTTLLYIESRRSKRGRP